MLDRDRPRIVRVILSVKQVQNQLKIVTALDSPALDELFHMEDGRTRPETEAAQGQAKQNADKFHKDHKPLPRGQRTNADDYNSKDEPKYDHAGIHLRFNNQDQIVWCTNDDLKFDISVAPDPELYHIRDEDEGHRIPRIEELISKAQSSFEDYQFRCKKGFDAASGPLLDTKRVRDQRYYRFFMRTEVDGKVITADPHYEGH
jgi:hypothetical protein